MQSIKGSQGGFTVLEIVVVIIAIIILAGIIILL